ncbi:MAG: hypothetical protein MJZ93_03120, partial [Paludibacteraceae bacterium]|nr:hypothetical protein [Paludibacteraceae bacterium]
MNKEEAIINGIRVRGIMHNMKRRCRWHNYSQKGTYMLTLVVDGRRPLLGRVVEVDPSTELKGTRAYVEKTELGRQIEEVEIKKIKHYYPMIDVWKVCIMPDHIHIILRVKEDLLNGLHLGKVIAGFKLGCNRAYWGICPSAELRGTVAGNTVKQRGTVAGN